VPVPGRQCTISGTIRHHQSRDVGWGHSSGVPSTVVSRRLCHASISITLDVYGHCLPADDEAAAATVAAAILGRGWWRQPRVSWARRGHEECRFLANLL
jgi:hypothetical protein